MVKEEVHNTKSVKVIKRSTLKETVYNKIKESGDPSNIKPTLDRALDAILECRIDNRVMATNPKGEDCLLTLMGAHVYTWHNTELIDSVRECFSNSDVVTEDWLKENNKELEYISELSEDDKRILSTN